MPHVLQWIKDWPPILATLGALLGVILTVRSANRTYLHGLIEKRRDHQRELIGDLVANTEQWCGLLDVLYPALTKMSTNDMIEFASTDSGRLQGELAKAIQVCLIKCLCEIGDGRIRPLLARLEVQRRTLTEGEDVAPMFNPSQNADARFEALLLMLKRVRGIKDTCAEIQIAAIEALPVEIEVISFSDRFRRWLSESMFVA